MRYHLVLFTLFVRCSICFVLSKVFEDELTKMLLPVTSNCHLVETHTVYPLDS